MVRSNIKYSEVYLNMNENDEELSLYLCYKTHRCKKKMVSIDSWEAIKVTDESE